MLTPTPRKLTERELLALEQWARTNKKSKMLDFFADLPRHIEFPRRTLVGSRQTQDFYVGGYAVTSAVIREIVTLDDHYKFNPHVDDIIHFWHKREERFDEDFHRSIASGLRLKPEKVCLAAHLGGCSDHIISAHSIQRSELAKLCRADNHLYGFKLGGAIDHRNFGLPELVGINVVTTFAGVCNRHDTELFHPIETKSFTATRRELFLYHYRALLFGHYVRTYMFKKVERIHDELTSSGHGPKFREMRNQVDANEIDRAEVAEEKLVCDQAYIGGTDSDMLLCAWICDKPPPLTGTTVIAPPKDFRGNRLQTPIGKRRLEWVTLTVTPKHGKTLVVLGANTKHESAIRLAKSFELIAEDERMHILITYCLCYMELFALIPRFWEGLDERQRESIIRTHQARYFPRRIPSLCRDRLTSVRLVG